MAKKKSAEKVSEARTETDAEQGEFEAAPPAVVDDQAGEANEEAAGDEAVVVAATPAFSIGEELGLIGEVQAFLNRRGDLAERLAREIEATERKLVELKRTAALLSPPVVAAPVEPAKPEKKAKKPTLKKAEKKPEAPRRLLDHAEQAGDDAGAVSDATEVANSQAEQELVA